ncbi:MAG: dihydrofolate reductase [Gammaproteobacteria bacterium RIFCSPLOWO2_02_FULL_42_14]|nr:MAG: dihydrofolate reductase [Gammaproteobacteria bacterium RIFCSPHIGHO2_02_FULL_42_43]OGT28645.1 MAG: dihydrofolate reductase [Gammaproteobacteria bacterium RIFCSPHIGHO2_01_FULL_42_8]OGT53541.1 MAG: dihydrofolate reductase [Gammaproteobacteria bacterium RIFCSPHIGHO2_12_FULL_41_25]OGT61485.1 MAG: dihydrofolate reductase [Gammaproteobacteria bacterium RIFCSPLOWO2_02_FULL_42_14]OGT86747.1 MAG: dihydrofolate reductase [Gammaproteobacteria bacterium RIFCSPLOWO2_12_FULL_42_18]
MKLSLIAAVSSNRVIGNNNRLPWHLPADLKHFKNLTLGKPVIMGRKTFDSIGKPLPNRRNIVISRDKNLVIAGCEIFYSIDSALQAVSSEPEVMIIGGANLYAQTIARADQLYLTIIDAKIDGDAFFPAWDKNQWQLISQERHEADEKNQYAYCFQMLFAKK